MSRSGYTDDCWGSELALWRGAVDSAICGRRGQAFLREMLVALDSLHAKELVKNDLEKDGKVCALGSVGLLRGVKMSDIDPTERNEVAAAFNIAPAMAAEIVYMNDEAGRHGETPEERFSRVRAWVSEQIRNEV